MASKNILIIDDDEETTILLEFLLSNRDGHCVTVIKDGYSAQDFINNDSPPDIVIMEIMLPYVSGLHLLEKMRATPAWSATRVIILTIKSGEKVVEEAFNLNTDDFIAKPFRTLDLISRINHQLSNVRTCFPHAPSISVITSNQVSMIAPPLALTIKPDMFFGLFSYSNLPQLVNKDTRNVNIEPSTKFNKLTIAKSSDQKNNTIQCIRFNY